MSMFREHRRRFLEVLAREGAAAVIPTAPARVRNHDSEHRYRPDSDFWWLTGFAEPEAALVLLPGQNGGKGEHGGKSVLFLREKDREREQWTGRRLGVEAAPAALGVDEARPYAKLWDELPALLRGVERVVWRAGLDEDKDRELNRVLANLRATAKAGTPPPLALLDPAPTLHELRLRKDAQELERMRRGAAITREAHTAAMRAARPGVNEREIDALLEHTFRKRGGTGASYVNIVAGGANACILHYVENQAPLVDGDLVLVDAGCEYEWYASDVTRTFPVNGRFSPEQRAVYEVVLAAQIAAIAEVRPGAAFDAPHKAAVRELARGIARLGLPAGEAKLPAGEAELPAGEARPHAGEADSPAGADALKRFYMHRTSHWLGLDVHDCGAYLADGKPRLLEPGMVITVEPGLYLGPDDETLAPRWRGIGVRIEDDVLVTSSGCEVLTAGIPKTVDEVEAACARASGAPVPA